MSNSVGLSRLVLAYKVEGADGTLRRTEYGQHDYFANLTGDTTPRGSNQTSTQTYDFNLRLNLAYPWAYISVGRALSFNDYTHIDTSINSSRIRSDYTDTFDLMVTKALGDILPFLDRNKSIFVNS